MLLSLMVFLLLVAETMPPTSDALPLIGIQHAVMLTTPHSSQAIVEAEN